MIYVFIVMLQFVKTLQVQCILFSTLGNNS